MDPLAVVAALIPSSVEHETVQIRLHPKKDPSIRMLDARASELFELLPQGKARGGINLQRITGFKQPDFVRTPIVQSLLHLSTPQWFAPSPAEEEQERRGLTKHLLKKERVLILDTDAGFDPDDFFAILTALRYYFDRLVGITTTLWHPLEKATVLRLLLDELGFPALPVLPGMGIANIGSEDTQLAEFKALYKTWPWKQFGKPYQNQGKAVSELYNKEYIAAKRADVFALARKILGLRTDGSVDSAAVEFIIQQAKRYPGKLTIASIGPMHNIAEALRLFPELANLATVVSMGGWMEDENGRPTRLGYNTVLGLDAADYVFKSEIPVLLVNSQTVLGLHLKNQSELPLIAAPETPSRISQWMVREITSWREHARATMDNIQYADPVTTILAGSPQFIESMDAVHLKLNLGHEGTMFQNARGFFEVQPDQSTRPNVFVIRELNRPEVIRQMVGSTLLGVTNPGLFNSLSKCSAILSSKSQIDGDSMVRRLFHERR